MMPFYPAPSLDFNLTLIRSHLWCIDLLKSRFETFVMISFAALIMPLSTFLNLTEHHHFRLFAEPDMRSVGSCGDLSSIIEVASSDRRTEFRPRVDSINPAVAARLPPRASSTPPKWAIQHEDYFGRYSFLSRVQFVVAVCRSKLLMGNTEIFNLVRNNSWKSSVSVWGFLSYSGGHVLLWSEMLLLRTWGGREPMRISPFQIKIKRLTHSYTHYTIIVARRLVSAPPKEKRYGRTH